MRAFLVGQVERQVVELDGPGIGDSGRLGETVEGDARVLEEGDRVLGPELEEVVAELRGPDGGHEPGTEHAVIERTVASMSAVISARWLMPLQRGPSWCRGRPGDRSWTPPLRPRWAWNAPTTIVPGRRHGDRPNGGGEAHEEIPTHR